MTKRIAIITFALFAASSLAFAQVDLEAVQDGADALSETLAPALPFNSTIGLNWSSAYIGQLMGIPPHFGVGFATGATTIKVDGIADMLSLIGDYALPSAVSDALPLPAAVVEGRIGGFLLPFDLGLKVGYLPDSAKTSLEDLTGGLSVDYLLVGADVRYALLKGNLLLPAISVGVGFNYLKGGLGTTVGSEQSFSFTGPDSVTRTLYLSAPDVGLRWESKTVDLKAQISKGLLIFTPYFGLGASYGMSSAGYYLESDVEYEDDSPTARTGISQAQINELKAQMETAGITPPDFTSTGISSDIEFSGWSFRAFGGLSMNIVVLRLDLTALYNIADGTYGISLGARFQL